MLWKGDPCLHFPLFLPSHPALCILVPYSSFHHNFLVPRKAFPPGNMCLWWNGIDGRAWKILKDICVKSFSPPSLHLRFFVLWNQANGNRLNGIRHEKRRRGCWLCSSSSSCLFSGSNIPFLPKCSACCVEAWCLQFRAMEEEEIFCLLFSDVNGFAPSHLRDSGA